MVDLVRERFQGSHKFKVPPSARVVLDVLGSLTRDGGTFIHSFVGFA